MEPRTAQSEPLSALVDFWKSLETALAHCLWQAAILGLRDMGRRKSLSRTQHDATWALVWDLASELRSRGAIPRMPRAL